MSFKVTRSAYQKLIDEDIAWLLEQPRTLERDHIALVLKTSVDMHYPKEPDYMTGAEFLKAADAYIEPMSEGEFEAHLKEIEGENDDCAAGEGRERRAKPT